MADEKKVPASKSIYGDRMTPEEIEAKRKRQKEQMQEAREAMRDFIEAYKAGKKSGGTSNKP